MEAGGRISPCLLSKEPKLWGGDANENKGIMDDVLPITKVDQKSNVCGTYGGKT